MGNKKGRFVANNSGSKDFLGRKIAFFGRNISYDIIILFLILLIGAYLRLSFLSSPSFWVDESISSMVSKNILEKGLPIFGSGAFYGRALVFQYSQAISLAIFGINDFAARLPSVIFGLLTILLAFLIGKEYNKKAGLLAAAFCAVFFLEVFYSKQARFYQLFQLAFFTTTYFLYKSRKNSRYLIPATLSFLVAFDTQTEALVLVPFFIIYVLLYNLRKWHYCIVPLIVPVIQRLNILFFYKNTSLSDGGIASVQLLASLYFRRMFFYINSFLKFSYFQALYFLFFFLGVIWAFFKKKDLTLLLILPSVLLVFGIFFYDILALRYIYFFFFLLILFSGVFFGLLSDRFGFPVIAVFFVIIIITSNLLVPSAYTTMLIPSQKGLDDPTAPVINYKSVPYDVSIILKQSNSRILTLFSPMVEWYFKKPDYVFGFSMTGKGVNTVSFFNSDLNKTVDIYSGAGFIDSKPSNEFYFVGDTFSLSKLNSMQKSQLNKILSNCSDLFRDSGVRIQKCT